MKRKFLVKKEADAVYIFLTNDTEDRIYGECQLYDIGEGDLDNLKFLFEDIEIQLNS